MSAYDEQAVGVRNLGRPSGELAPSGERPSWMYAEGKWDAFRGPDHHPIDEEAFFRIVGRNDLLRRYHHEAVVKKSLTIGGGSLVFGGLLFAAITSALRYGGAQPAIVCEGGPCTANRPGPSPVWGLAVAGAGVISVIAGHSLDPTPIDADQADALARDYDRSLRSRVGLSETSRAATDGPTPSSLLGRLPCVNFYTWRPTWPSTIVSSRKLLQIGGQTTKKETVTQALLEYVQRRKQARILDLFGKVDFDPKYDSKRQRRRP